MIFENLKNTTTTTTTTKSLNEVMKFFFKKPAETLKLMDCPFQNQFNYSKEDLDMLLMYKHYINGWLSMFVILIGILANSITICALLHRYMRKSSTNAYLLALSSSNLFSLICLFLMTGLRFTLVHPYRVMYCKHWYENFIGVSLPYLTPINQLFQLSGIYLIMAVSIDRYILVRNHAKSTEKNRRKRKLITWVVILTIFLFCVLFTLPNWFTITSASIEINLTIDETKSNLLRSIYTNSIDNDFNLITSNQTTQQSEIFLSQKVKYIIAKYTQFGDNMKVLLSIYLYIPFVIGLPVVLLLVVNFLITFELIKIGDRKRLLGTAARIDRNITIMLVMIVLVFLMCQLPLTFSHIFSAYNPKLMHERKFFIYNSFTNFLTCVYLSANFALFCFFGQAFRDTIQYMFCIRRDLPDQAKRPSILLNMELSRYSAHSGSIFQNVVNSMFGTNRRSLTSVENGGEKLIAQQRSRNARKSLPTLNNAQRSINTILELDEQLNTKLIGGKKINNKARIKVVQLKEPLDLLKTAQNELTSNPLNKVSTRRFSGI